MLQYKRCVFFIFTLLFSLMNFCSSQAIRKSKPAPFRDYHDWDYILFSQRWPITACAQWEEAKPENTCNMPKDKTTWTIHGLWPTQTGTEGPVFCPSAIHFDRKALDPILNDLNAYWVNIEENTKPYSFWRHEWDKHGTCASTLPLLDSVQNYFQQGLDWNKQYKLSDILAKSNIVPSSDGYTVEQIYNAVKSYTKKDPTIQCVVEKNAKVSMISEIRICFNKSLEVIDCDATNSDGNNPLESFTNCNLKNPVMYFAEVPFDGISYEMDYVDDTFKQHFEQQIVYINLYRILRFITWFTT